jgi:heme oxygenase
MIMDFKMKKLDPSFPEKKYRIYPDIIEEDLYDAGYENIVVDDTSLDAQYIITATNPQI